MLEGLRRRLVAADAVAEAAGPLVRRELLERELPLLAVKAEAVDAEERQVQRHES